MTENKIVLDSKRRRPITKFTEAELLDGLAKFVDDLGLIGSGATYSVYDAVLNERKKAIERLKEAKRKSKKRFKDIKKGEKYYYRACG